MSTGDGGAATRPITTSAITIKVKCAWCSVPFAPKGTNPEEKFCSRHCLKMARAENQPEKRQSLRRKNSLSSVQPVTPQPTVETAAKRNLSLTQSPESASGPATKRGRNDVSGLLSTLTQVNLASLGKPDLIRYLKSCMACMQDMQEDSDNSVHLDRIRSLENTVEGLKAEIVDIKVAFADKTLTNIRKASTPTYADSVRGSVLVAHFADGEKPADPINVAALEKMIDTKSNGLIPQSVRERDNSVYITFNDTADVVKAASIFKNQSDCSRIFKTVSPLEIRFPVVAHNVDVSNLSSLQSEIEYRNPLFKGQIHSIKLLYTKPNTAIGHVKIFLISRQASLDVLRKGTLYCSDGPHRVVEVDLNREVRRCYKCQRYGHTQHNCKAKQPACGKCAEHHLTNVCSASKAVWKCVNCSGAHQTGDRKCIKQIAAVEKYRTFLER